MQYCELPPRPQLRQFIKLFWSLEDEPAGETESVLPDGCPEIVFNLSDRFRRVQDAREAVQPATLFAGQMSCSITIRPTGRVRLFGVRFHPAGAFPLVRVPMREMYDEIVDIAQCIGRAGAELEEKIAVAANFAGRVSLFEDFFLSRLASAKDLHAVSARAVARIVAAGGSISVRDLTREIGTSERTLERSFQNHVGISAKMLARIVRFQSLLTLIQKADTPGNLGASLELGYYDQSHAIRDFREFSGKTPLGYFQMVHRLSDVFTLSGSRAMHQP